VRTKKKKTKEEGQKTGIRMKEGRKVEPVVKKEKKE